MDKLVGIEVVKLPALLAVGRELRYSDDALNAGDNRLPAFWDACEREHIFAPLEAQAEFVFDPSHAGVFLDWYLGDGDFSHVVGILMKLGAAIPDGYFVRKLAAAEGARCRVKCKSLLERRAISFDPIAGGLASIGRSCANMKWCADLFHPQRAAETDGDGYAILDCLIPLDEQEAT